MIHQAGIKIIASSEKAKKNLYQTKLDTALAIVMGSEDKGINQSLYKYIDEQIKIPMFGKIESLNMSVAAAICLYEAVRQRAL